MIQNVCEGLMEKLKVMYAAFDFDSPDACTVHVHNTVTCTSIIMHSEQSEDDPRELPKIFLAAKLLTIEQTADLSLEQWA